MFAIDLGAGHVAGDENLIHPVEPQEFVNLDAAQAVARHGQLFGHRVGAHAGGPDHGGRLDAGAAGQGDAVAIDGRDLDPGAAFDSELGGRSFDDGPRLGAHIGTDVVVGIGEDDSPVADAGVRRGAPAIRMPPRCR